LTALPDAKTEITNVVADGENWVFTEFIGRGTHTGALVGPAGTIPPTGRRIGFPVGELMRLEGGKFVLVHVYYDGATLLRQLGVFPPRPEVIARILIHQAKKLHSRVRERR
jgi:predicted ester cyclase